MIGTIQQANKSKSGKTLSLQIDGVWYTSKNWELEQAVNRRVIFEPSEQTLPDGSSIKWLNDYVFEDAATTPAAAAMDQAMAGQPLTPPVAAYRDVTKAIQSRPDMPQDMPLGQPPVAPQPQIPTKDRDASIVAQALTKACTAPGDDVELVWSRYTSIYHKYMGWDPSVPF